MRKFISGLICGVVISASGLVIAASGDFLIQIDGGSKEISAATATCFANCAINATPAALWTESASKMHKCTAYRAIDSSTGYMGHCTGRQSVAPASVNASYLPMRVIEIEP